MKNTKIFNVRATLVLIIIISLLSMSLATSVFARNSKQMLRDGLVSDEGVSEGNIEDGIISDVPEDTTLMPDLDGSDNASDGGSSESGSESGADSMLGPGGMAGESNSGINENDFANGNNTTDNGTASGEVTEEEAGSTVGIVIAILVLLAIIIAIILLVPKTGRSNNRQNKK